MNEGYEEILVKKKTTAKDMLLKGLVIACTVVPVVGGILLVMPLAILIGVLVGFLGYWLLLPSLDLEYEYLYVEGEIDVDKIMARRKRKRAASFSKDNLLVMAPTGSDQLSEYLKRGKVVDYTSGEAGVRSWTLVYGGEDGEKIVMLEIPDEIAQDMRRYAPRKVFFS